MKLPFDGSLGQSEPCGDLCDGKRFQIMHTDDLPDACRQTGNGIVQGSIRFFFQKTVDRVAVAVVGYFVFSHRSESVAIDDFDAAFSVGGIYEGTRQ